MKSHQKIASVLFALVLTAICQHRIVAQSLAATSFEAFVEKRFKAKDPAWEFDAFCPVRTDAVAARVLWEYGAMFAADDSVIVPDVCIYRGEHPVIQFQKKLQTKSLEFGRVRIQLQTSAADALQRVVSQAALEGLTVTPLDGAIAGSRSYGRTLMLWNGRVFSALDHWQRRGRLTEADRMALARLELQQKVEKIIEWESQGIFFSKDKRRSIFTSTAPPGASHHIAMIAFDVVEYGNPRLREILNSNGWYQSVVDDPPHFTFLGVAEGELPGRGLRAVDRGSYRYWVPDTSAATN